MYEQDMNVCEQPTKPACGVLPGAFSRYMHLYLAP